ncbi:MAG TPA: hypothetical protein VK501_20235 [Baekduia sp.]|uniref:hypothetical protein n=1 Tax=Baekduia sp. TaxID=2600305 RepID=UPI002BEBB8FE|nr:hypothetical protein [Baekduia sp.]HMJ36241.1 hypothetical protein [Baekduia sp.]
MSVPVARNRRRLAVRATGVAVGAAAAAGALLAFTSGDGAHGAQGHPLPMAVTVEGLADRSGVRDVRVHVTGGGGLLDVRYEVVDPGKAALLHDAGTPPAIVYEPTGTPIEGLLMGHLPHGSAKPGVSSFMIFVNPGNIVRPGDEVGVILGPARLPHVRVE